ncbi:MAG: UPF0182 family protein [Gammaproteobacteria bacterium]|nr:MAG: UPF0182 family protein [Gammaproteobacteria bacterium]
MSPKPIGRRTLTTELLAGLAAIIGVFWLLGWLSDFLWFQAIGYTSVFWTLRLLKLSLFLAVFALVLAYLWANLRALSSRLNWADATRALGRRFTSGYPSRSQPPPPGNLAAARLAGAAGAPLAAKAVAIALAVVFAFALAARWDLVLRFWWSQPYGMADPVYGRDIGFYLFRLPLLELVQNTLLVLVTIVTGLLAWLYVEVDALRPSRRTGFDGHPRAVAHLACNVAALLLLTSWGYWLDRFALLLSDSGAVFGAGYTAVTVERPALWLMAAVAAALGFALLLPDVRRRFRWLAIGAMAYVVLGFAGVVIAPWAVQSFVVEPNELELETPFLENNIALTREAFGLAGIEERVYEGFDGLSLARIAANRATIDNIRLWDWRPLGRTFRQLQRIRAYYEFGDVDVDRYQVDGRYRQVMLAARELTDDLPDRADTWLNRYLQYTHGYGLAMSLTAEKSDQGSPVLIIKDVPPKTVGGLVVTEPAIYYGENMSDYRLVTTAVPEFDYPRGDENVYSTYRGRGGVPLDAFWKKLLFAWDQGDFNLLISAYLTPESRIQLYRRVEERVRRIAPFLELDSDPYPVLSNGRIFWIVDAYTLSSWFPYSEPDRRDFNYIRNSVKVVVDAYNGAVRFYVIDPDDPVIGVYQRALPALFHPIGDMPADLRRHLRYPQALFKAQVGKFNIYHMTVPQVFYNGEDVWAIPKEKYGGDVIAMEPYYVLMRLPGEQRLQYLLMTPVVAQNRDNMIAWIAARSDFPGYGQLLMYKLPKNRLILGPIQIEATIDQDTLISQQLSLWDQRGSRVIRGNLLVIPIDNSFLYVEPVYLIAEDLDIPQLKRIIVSDGRRLAMEPTLEEALAAVVGSRVQETEATLGPEGSEQLAAARAALAEAEAALRDADWDAFGRAMQLLKQVLENAPRKNLVE